MSCFFFFKQKTAYVMRISDWSSDVCSSDLLDLIPVDRTGEERLQVGKPRSHADMGQSQLLASDRFQAGCKLKSETPAKCKDNRVLDITFNILSMDSHVDAMSAHGPEHGLGLEGHTEHAARKSVRWAVERNAEN